MSARRVRITVDDVELYAAWGDSETADAVFDSLPLTISVSYWGDEAYGTIPVQAEAEPGASDVVEPGAVAFWPPGNCLCLFWGPTPASHGDECRAADAVNVVGQVEDVEALRGLRGRTMTVEAV